MNKLSTFPKRAKDLGDLGDPYMIEYRDGWSFSVVRWEVSNYPIAQYHYMLNLVDPNGKQHPIRKYPGVSANIECAKYSFKSVTGCYKDAIESHANINLNEVYAVSSSN